MTRYTVQWDPELEASLVHYWTAASSASRDFFTQVSNWIDRELATNADQKGQARANNERTLVVVRSRGSIKVDYQVFVEDRVVFVECIKFIPNP